MSFIERYPIRSELLTKPSRRRSGQLITPGVRFIVAHDTGNPGSTAQNNISYYESTRDRPKPASAHIFVDDHEIVECIPALVHSPPEKAWHVLYDKPTDDQLFGFDANDAALAIEYCFGGRIDADQAYARYVWVIAYACFKFDLDPRRSIVGHYFLDPERKTDPVTGLAHSRRSMEQLQRDVVSVFVECGGQLPDASVAPGPLNGNVLHVVATMKLNVRAGRPSRLAPVARSVPVGEHLDAIAMVEGEAINSNPHWYQTANDGFVWSGGVRPT